MSSFTARRIALLEEESAVKIQALCRGIGIRGFQDICHLDSFETAFLRYAPLYTSDGNVFDKVADHAVSYSWPREVGSTNGVKLCYYDGHSNHSEILFETWPPRFVSRRPWLPKRTTRTLHVPAKSGPTRKVAKAMQREFEFKLNRPLLTSVSGVPVPEHYKHPQIKWRGLGGGGVRGGFYRDVSDQISECTLKRDMRLERTLNDALKRSADAGHLKRAAATAQTKIIKRAKIAGEANGIHRCATIFRAMRDGETIYLPRSEALNRRFTFPSNAKNGKLEICDNTVRLTESTVPLELTYELHSSHMQRYGHHCPGYRQVYTQRSGFGAQLAVRTNGLFDTVTVMSKRGRSVAEHVAYRNMNISGFNRHFLKDKDDLLRGHVMRHLLGFCMFNPEHIKFKSRYTWTPFGKWGWGESGLANSV